MAVLCDAILSMQKYVNTLRFEFIDYLFLLICQGGLSKRIYNPHGIRLSLYRTNGRDREN